MERHREYFIAMSNIMALERIQTRKRPNQQHLQMTRNSELKPPTTLVQEAQTATTQLFLSCIISPGLSVSSCF